MTKIGKSVYEVVCEECDDIQTLYWEELVLDCDDWEETK